MAALLAAAAPIPAMAQTGYFDKPAPDRIIDIAQPEVVVQTLQEEGYKAVLNTPKDDQPYIQSAANGSSFTVQFYGCTGGKDCTSLEFYAWYKKTPTFTTDFANRWNSSKRFMSVSIDSDGDLALYQYVSTTGKTTYANFADDIDWWSQMNGELDKFIDEEDAKVAATPTAPDAKKR
jgi:hypothetical protein